MQASTSSNQTNYPPLILSFFIGMMFAIVVWARSTGFPLDDEIGHYLTSRYSLQHPILLLDLWGRPINTLLYALPASIGGFGLARGFSLLLSCLTAIFAIALGKQLGIRRLWLIPVFFWFQPWVAQMSFTVLTEIPFSLLMLAAVYAWNRERWGTASLAVALLPLVRHEGIALLAIWALYLIIKGRWRPLIVALMPLAVFNIIYFTANHRWAFMLYFQPKPTGFYGAGSWFHYIPRIAYKAGPLLGLLALATLPDFRLRRDYRQAVIGYACYLAVHTAIFRFGLFASGGYVEFLYPLAPILAILGVAGLEKCLRLVPRKETIVVIAAVSILILYGLFIGRPYPLSDEGKSLRDAVIWIQNNGYNPQKVLTSHVYAIFLLNQPIRCDQEWTKAGKHLDGLRPGDLVLWDAHYSERFGLNRTLLEGKKFQMLAQFGDGKTVVYKTISPTSIIDAKAE